MLTGKQRSYLRKLSHGIRPVLQIGKEGITESFLNQFDETIEINELIKVSVLENSGLDAKEAANYIVEKRNVEFVQAIGKKFVLYKESEENPEIKFPRKL